ncbi:MAG: hypothetical protein ACOZAJ_00290 [Patescibacteria group bacterium]
MTKRGIFSKPSGFSRWLNLIIIGLVLFLSALLIWLFWGAEANKLWPADSYVGLANNIETVQPSQEPVSLSETCLVGNPCSVKIKAVDPEGDNLIYEFYSLPDKKSLLKPMEAASGEVIAPSIIFDKPGQVIFSVLVKDEAGHAAPEKQLLALVKEN